MNPLRTLLPRAGVVTALALAGLTPTTARAAVVPDPITGISVFPSPYADAFDTFTTSIGWCVPEGSRPGSKYTLLLPDLLGNWPTSVALKNASGAVLADGVINPGPPSVLTITVADGIVGQTSLCGTTAIQANARNAAALAGTTQTLEFTSSAKTWTMAPIQFTRGAATPWARTWGTFTGVDQCRVEGANCLKWGVETQLGPVTNDVVVSDTAWAGQTFDCSRLVPYFVDATGSYVRMPARYEYRVDACSPAALHVTFRGIPAGLKGTVLVPASVAKTPAGGATYSNRATVSAGGTQQTVSASLTSAVAAGSGIGTAITVHKSDSNGNAGDTRATRVRLPSGSTRVVVTATNNGPDPLTKVSVDDTTFTGTGLLEGLSCNFSTAAAGAPTSGTQWAGPWPAGSTITCSGLLSGVTPLGHGDVATVTGTNPAGDVVRGRDVYYAVQPTVSIGDRVWWDTNRNGRQDAGEPSAAGVGVRLLDPKGAVVRTTKTDAAGRYAFVNLTPGTQYTLAVTPPAGVAFTTTPTGARGPLDSKVDRSGRATVRTPLDGRNLATTPDDPTYDAGLVPGATVGDRVWYDANRNGIQDRGEKGIRDVSVSLVGPTGRPAVDVAGRPVPAQRTNADGQYLFTGLPVLAAKQHYTVRVQTPRGYMPTSAGRGPDRGRDPSTGSASTTAALATNGAADLGLDFGFWRPVKRSYLVALDTYFPDIAGNRAATDTNRRLVASLDDDGILKYREDMGTGCFARRRSATCMWWHSDWRILPVDITTDASVAPTAAQLVTAVNALRPRGWAPLVSTDRVSTVSGTISMAWILGKGATAAQAWGPRHDIPETFLGHS